MGLDGGMVFDMDIIGGYHDLWSLMDSDLSGWGGGS